MTGTYREYHLVLEVWRGGGCEIKTRAAMHQNGGSMFYYTVTVCLVSC